MLYEAAISLFGKNAEFKAVHEYYRTHKENPLKKMQTVIVVACKILRVFYTILTKGVDYDAGRLEVCGTNRGNVCRKVSVREPYVTGQ